VEISEPEGKSGGEAQNKQGDNMTANRKEGRVERVQGEDLMFATLEGWGRRKI
jgi:hypothetical protein